jgi:hypothetical protein
MLFSGRKVEKSLSAHKIRRSHDPTARNYDYSENLKYNILLFQSLESISWKSVPDTSRSLSALDLQYSVKMMMIIMNSPRIIH